MIVLAIQKNKIIKLQLPESIDGEYILRDFFGVQISNIQSKDNKWIISPAKNYKLLSNNTDIANIVLTDYISFNIQNLITGDIIEVYTYPTYEQNPLEYKSLKPSITVGSGDDNDIVYKSPKINPKHLTITNNNGKWYLECEEKCYVFVDGRLAKKKRLKHGETLFLHGLRIICIGDFIVVINCVHSNTLSFKNGSFEKRVAVQQEINKDSFFLESEVEALDKSNEFFRSPRFRTQVTNQHVKIKKPKSRKETQVQPSILTVGPQMTMMISAIIGLFTTVTNSMQNGLDKAIPSIAVTVIALISSYFWPYITNIYNKRQIRRYEALRVKEYRRYLEEKDKEITSIIENQKQILLENSISLEECQKIIVEKKRNLWERQITDEDFLKVRVGTGYVKPEIDIEVESEEVEAGDILYKEMNELVQKHTYIENAPLNISFLENRISAIVGNYGVLQLFFENILLQLMTFHMYNELKIVVLTNENYVKNWENLKFSPHCWDNSKQRRFIAATIDEKKQLSTYLEQIYKSRIESLGEKQAPTDNNKEGEKKESDEYKAFDSYYLIIIDDLTSSRSLEIVKDVLKSNANVGFSVIIKNDKISNLPNQCSTFFNITDTESGMFKNNLSEKNQLRFVAELNKTVDIEYCIQQMANIYVNVPKEAHELPKSVGFMEMYGVGNVNQLNSISRWSQNNPVASLAVPIGIDQQGELFNFDIHEKAYGPHGLVAGTTGSGKSEWIITYILSLAINFSPEEVQFVLIDYKGGGLAGSFVNSETGLKLPHLVGTITNLDKSDIRRSLASLEAESKRRQQMFNEAREKLNDSSMNIYKYQQYYRQGMLDEPLSHLLIISDEFAELKSQEPEFLNQLVSIARIGRSLGIHLILATQKPAGVVDEQMWTNSRFKVCLRVQDTSDSNDMIKKPDAAYLHQTGAFYLQVGLNEVFALGQSAYAGNKYVPTSIMKKNIDTSVDILDRIGNSVQNLEYIEPVQENSNANVQGEELLNIVMYLSNIAQKGNYKVRSLWLDNIPENIYVDELKKEYDYKRSPFHLAPIIGKYDDPYKQYQGLLTLDIDSKNSFIVGQTGSGKEQLLQSAIYSCITNYLPQEVCIYICDFGGETLSMFEEAPHVADIVYSKDKSKVFNLFKHLKKVYKQRVLKYRDFGGTYTMYNKQQQQIETRDPLIVTVINNVTLLKEQYEEQFEELEKLLDDAAKYGIVFIEADNEINSHRSTVLEDIHNKIALRMNDYIPFLGSKVKDIKPKELKGRGLVVMNDEGYELQTAKICDDAVLQRNVKIVCKKLYEAYNYKHAPIPSIPNPINIDCINKESLSINNICIGYSVKNIEPMYFDLERNVGTLVVGSKKGQVKKFFRVFNRELDEIVTENNKVYLFDPENIFKPEGYNNITYVPQEEIVNTIDNLMIYINNEYEKYSKLDNKNEYTQPKHSVLVFYSTSQIYALIGYDKVEMLTEAFDKALELHLFSFVIADNINDFKEVQREKSIMHLFMEGNGICIGTTHETQVTIDINSRDIKMKDALSDKLGYAVLVGKGKLVQVFQDTKDDEEEEDE